MITSLHLVNFKNFADETLHLGPFTLIVGPNASGKSNIRDAFRFLHGIGREYTLAETMGGRYGEGGNREWTGIRGAPNEVIRFGQDEFSIEVELKPIVMHVADVRDICFGIQIGREDDSGGSFKVVSESLAVNSGSSDSVISGTLYESNSLNDGSDGAEAGRENLRISLPVVKRLIEVPSDQPCLSQLNELIDKLDNASRTEASDMGWTRELWAKFGTSLVVLACMVSLARVRFLELLPERLQEPSIPGAIRLGDFGENLPTVLDSVCSDPHRKSALLSWLHELSPMDVSDLEFPEDLNGRVNLRIREANGRAVSAYSASDGTLRFLGMLAALLNEDFEGLYFIEEIDNGIHPARLHLLLDLIERQTAKGKIQVVATTHSPDVLNIINDTTFENAAVVYRDENSSDAVIRRVAELPNARELRKSQGLGRLHAGGWMENILSFAEAETEYKKGGE